MARIFQAFVVTLFALLLALPATAGAQNDVESMRAQQIAAQNFLKMIEWDIDALQTQLVQGRTLQVYAPLLGFEGYDRATSDEAYAAMTLEYLIMLERDGTPFDQAEFDDFIHIREQSIRDLRPEMEKTLFVLQTMAERIKMQIAHTEAEIAKLLAPPPPPPPPVTPPSPKPQANAATGQVCAGLVGVERLFDLGEAASTAPEAATHSVTHRGSFDGHVTDGTLTWTAPPLRLCEGDEFTVEMNAVNAAPPFRSGMAYVASVSVRPARGEVEVVSCTNPPRPFGQSDHSAAVQSDRSAWTNTCTYRVRDLGAFARPTGLIQADIAAKPATGLVTYLYQSR